MAEPRVLVAGVGADVAAYAHDIRTRCTGSSVVEAVQCPPAPAGRAVSMPDAGNIVVDVVVSAFQDVGALREFLSDVRALLPGHAGDLVVLDMGVADPQAFGALAQSVRSASIVLHGARRLHWRQDGAQRSLLYVDRVASDASYVRPLLGALADTVVPVADAKAMGMLADLLRGVATTVGHEGVRIARRAGVSSDILALMLSRGSGAAATLSEVAADEEALAEGLSNDGAAGHRHDDVADHDGMRRGMAAGVAIAHASRHPLPLAAPALALTGRVGVAGGASAGAIAS